jgi:hypothetical protein
MRDLKNLQVLMALGLMSMGTASSAGSRYDPQDVAPVPKVIPAGCKEYTFQGYTVVAISEASARKKCNKLRDKHLKR